MNQKNEFFIYCNCDAHLLRFQLANYGTPEVYISLFEQGYRGNCKFSFWQRLRSAWKEFRGTLVHDSIYISNKQSLVDLHNKSGQLVEAWDLMELESKGLSMMDKPYYLNLSPTLDEIYEGEYNKVP